ncbi:MAG: DNA mismatch repair endonuclease MutL [Bacteroidota bacterium]|nr:DNA mismatch repair endonuclease MutL [Bacteroidota bacterium]
MAQTIKILPDSLANKIAAGEVVQRPASAVKELIENSIDASAKSITIIIKDGGKSLIHVVDDGEGMSAEDAAMVFHRHATSKISSYEDLENIRTLGFRGEALASITAISQVELRTRTEQSEIGTKVRIDGSTLLDISEESSPKGTSIQVKNLFYNTPGRRNFLKSNTTEFRHIADVVQRIAISHPDLKIVFISDQETVFDLKPSSLQDRIKAIFGEQLADSLIYFENETDFLNIHGYLGKPNFARKGKTEQYLFLNKRYIVNRTINHAVFNGYENLLEKGSFPLFILFLTLDPHKVDVNVHPTKLEVKFEDESAIYRFVMSGVRKGLSKYDLFPSIKIEENQLSSGKLTHSFFPTRDAARSQENRWEQLYQRETSPELNAARGGESQIESCLQSVQSNIWQVHNKYILVPVENGIMIVDQHAAHERILYERVIARFNKKENASQQLLFPHTIQMTPGNALLVKQLLTDLEKLGFNLKLFGTTTIIMDGIPMDVKPSNEDSILQDIIDAYKEDEQKIKLEPRERLAKSFACMAAIKTGEPLNGSEMLSLLNQLGETEIPTVCPHGRPVSIKLSLSELDKRFGRTS